ncbi:MAG: hypothetical protein AABW99_00495 [archaeon]
MNPHSRAQASIEITIIAALVIAISMLVVFKYFDVSGSVNSVANYRQDLIHAIGDMDSKYYVKDLNYSEDGGTKIQLKIEPNPSGSDLDTICATKIGHNIQKLIINGTQCP